MTVNSYYKLLHLITAILLFGDWQDLMSDLKGDIELFAEWLLDQKMIVDEKNIVSAWMLFREHLKVNPRFPSAKLKAQIYERDGYKCTKCGATEELCIDHVIPWSKYGKTVMENLVVLCGSCNRKKSNSCF